MCANQTGQRSLLSGVKVMVVDDDAAGAKLMSVILRGEGCEVRVVRSAEDALTELQTFHPQMIALDLVLPMMGGLLFAQQLKSNPQTRDIVLIAVTIFNGAAAERMALDAGCSAYVRKPVDPESFVQLIESQLRGTP